MESEQRGFGERQVREWERVRRVDQSRLRKAEVEGKGKGKGKEKEIVEEGEREDEVSWVDQDRGRRADHACFLAQMEVEAEEDSRSPKVVARVCVLPPVRTDQARLILLLSTQTSKSSTPSSTRTPESSTSQNLPQKKARSSKWAKPPDFVARDIPDYEFPEVDIPEGEYCL